MCGCILKSIIKKNRGRMKKRARIQARLKQTVHSSLKCLKLVSNFFLFFFGNL